MPNPKQPPSAAADPTAEARPPKPSRLPRQLSGNVARKSKALVVFEIVGGLSAIIASLIAILAWLPQAQDTLWPNEKYYKMLGELNAGHSVARFDSELGPPTLIRVHSTSTPVLTERLYMKEQFVVSTLTPSEGNRTMVYSVLSCNPEFQPSFHTPDGRTLQLQSKPLDALDGVITMSGSLNYSPGATGSSVRLNAEMAVRIPATASSNRAYAYGVNGACGPTALPRADGSYNQEFKGTLGEAPDAVRSYRHTVAPNFYAEAYPEDGFLDFETIIGIASPYHFDLPARYLNESGTRTFGR
ncbi:hypothetical protein D9M72_325580 [compost metagenome]